mgnify:CR=1 FL=1
MRLFGGGERDRSLLSFVDLGEISCKVCGGSVGVVGVGGKTVIGGGAGSCRGTPWLLALLLLFCPCAGCMLLCCDPGDAYLRLLVRGVVGASSCGGRVGCCCRGLLKGSRGPSTGGCGKL